MSEKVDISTIEAKWFVLHTFASYEKTAKDNLERVFEKNGMADRLLEIIIPEEDVVEEKKGRRKVVQKKLFPGYIFIKMHFHNDSMWHMIVNTRGVTGFVGPKGWAIPLSEDEIRKLKLEKAVTIDTNFEVGDRVTVVLGPLGGNGYVGDIEEIDVLANKVKVAVNMFGRVMSVDMGLDHIEKLEESINKNLY